MYKFDRMEWPKRYKIKGSVLLLVVVSIIFGIYMQKRSNQNLVDSIVISELSFDDWGSQYIELGYTIENKNTKEINTRLLAQVWDKDGMELASALFDISVPPGLRQTRSKLLDKLSRSLKEGERPYKANITIFQRKI